MDREESNRRLLANIEVAKKWDDEEVERWRNATDEERAREVTQLLLYAEAVERATGRRYEPDPPVILKDILDRRRPNDSSPA